MTAYRRIVAALLIALAMLTYMPSRAETPADYDMSAPGNLSAGHLYAKSALLVDEDSGVTLFSKDSRVRMYPASTTKIMTLLLALESGIPMDEQVAVPREAADIEKGSSVIPVQPGDVLSFSDLLYGFMLTSGNDGANAIAVLVDGNIAAFVDRMNARAAELGCEGTHYSNAHGYHDADHYTTAADLAVISRAAMRNPDFRAIVAAPTWTLTIQRGDRTVTTDVVNRNSLLISGDKYYYPDCTGIKTGHHNKAGWCFVGSAERDGKRVICVALDCELEEQKWYDAARLFEYGFTRYSPVTVEELLDAAKERFASVTVENADPNDPEGGALELTLTDIEGGEQTLQLVSGSEVALAAAVSRVTDGIQIDWTRGMEAPVAAGERFGTLRLTLEDGIEAPCALTASRAVAAKPAKTATPAPRDTEVPAASTANPQAPARRGGGILPVVIAGLLLILALTILAAALTSRNARKRRRRRKGSARRRPRDMRKG